MTNENKKGVNYTKIFLIVFGALTAVSVLIIVGIIVALAIIKPFGINVLKTPALIFGPSSDAISTYDHPLLSAEQEVMLESIGFDTTTIPTSITAEQQECAIEALGQERVNEISAGSAPTITDLLKAQDCL